MTAAHMTAADHLATVDPFAPGRPQNSADHAAVTAWLDAAYAYALEQTAIQVTLAGQCTGQARLCTPAAHLADAREYLDDAQAIAAGRSTRPADGDLTERTNNVVAQLIDAANLGTYPTERLDQLIASRGTVDPATFYAVALVERSTYLGQN